MHHVRESLIAADTRESRAAERRVIRIEQHLVAAGVGHA